MKRPGAEWQRVALEAIVIAALGAVIGLSLHYRLILDAFSRPEPPASAAPAPAVADYPTPVGLADVRQLLDAGALAVDARIPEMYRAGHLPGAVSLPLEEAETALPEFQRQIPAGRTLITFCSGYGCPDSFDLALVLRQAGYRDVRVFEGGFPQWRDAGLPVEESP